MKTINTKSEIVEVNGVKGWNKKCIHCGKTYFTTSRKQKFCSTECNKKYQSRKKVEKSRYDESKEVQRLWARSHSIAVEVVNQLIKLGVRESKCDCCGCTEEHLVVHHKDLNFLNNSPSNLVLVCTKCHNQIHSDYEKNLTEQGILLEDSYEDSIQPFMKKLGRTSRHR